MKELIEICIFDIWDFSWYWNYRLQKEQCLGVGVDHCNFWDPSHDGADDAMLPKQCSRRTGDFVDVFHAGAKTNNFPIWRGDAAQ